LADEENVCYVCAVHLEGGFWEGLRGVEDLLDCYWSEGFVVPVSGLCVWEIVSWALQAECSMVAWDVVLPFLLQGCWSRLA
jgi:hypothetical protein